MATLNQLRAYGRIGLLATTLLLGGALVLGAWSNYLASRAALDALYRGQAELLQAALRTELPPWSTPDSTALQAFVDSFPQFGVTYLAITSFSGEVLASVGQPAAPLVLPERRDRRGADDDLQHAGDRVRLISTMPVVPPTPEHPSRDLQREAERSIREGMQRGRNLGAEIERALGTFLRYQVVDFEPVVASTLVSRASRSLVLSIISASILTLAALLFWRTSERYAAARVRLEEQRRLSVLGEMSAVMAHEIRNPLASLKGTAQLLAEKLPAGSRELQRAQRIVAESVRLETLTSDLLDFARSGPIERGAVDPVELVRESISEVNGEILIDAADAPLTWRIDARRLRHALVNILQNAVQAVPAAEPPRVNVTEQGRQLLIEVRDFGPGLPPDVQGRVFDPFFTTRTNGTGLGLAVAQRVVEMHGGTLTAGNHPGGGAVFRILIPAPAG